MIKLESLFASQSERSRWATALLSPNNSLSVFGFALLMAYGVVPFFAWCVGSASDEYLVLAGLTCLALLAMCFGGNWAIFDHRIGTDSALVQVDGKCVVALIWCLFFVFGLYVIFTAPTVPLLSALQGVDAYSLSEERGAFLKGRQGIESALLYISTIMTSTLVPYSLLHAFAFGYRIRYIALALFIIYCLSFMQKALFLNALMPLIVLIAMKGYLSRRLVCFVAAGTFVALLGLVAFSYDGNKPETLVAGSYFSASYLPAGSLDYLVWRVFVVPIFTAADTLAVHREMFNSEHLFGATSSFFAFVCGFDRVNIERHVADYQFGGSSQIANSNAVFFIDGFVNFGWLGVFLYGLVAGQVFRLFRFSGDLAFRALWPIFAFQLFSGSLIGTVLSNGWGLLVLCALFFKVSEWKADKTLSRHLNE